MGEGKVCLRNVPKQVLDWDPLRSDSVCGVELSVGRKHGTTVVRGVVGSWSHHRHLVGGSGLFRPVPTRRDIGRDPKCWEVGINRGGWVLSCRRERKEGSVLLVLLSPSPWGLSSSVPV